MPPKSSPIAAMLSRIEALEHKNKSFATVRQCEDQIIEHHAECSEYFHKEAHRVCSEMNNMMHLMYGTVKSINEDLDRATKLAADARHESSMARCAVLATRDNCIDTMNHLVSVCRRDLDNAVTEAQNRLSAKVDLRISAMRVHSLPRDSRLHQMATRTDSSAMPSVPEQCDAAPTPPASEQSASGIDQDAALRKLLRQMPTDSAMSSVSHMPHVSEMIPILQLPELIPSALPVPEETEQTSCRRGREPCRFAAEAPQHAATTSSFSSSDRGICRDAHGESRARSLEAQIDTAKFQAKIRSRSASVGHARASAPDELLRVRIGAAQLKAQARIAAERPRSDSPK